MNVVSSKLQRSSLLSIEFLVVFFLRSFSFSFFYYCYFYFFSSVSYESRESPGKKKGIPSVVYTTYRKTKNKAKNLLE